MTFFLYVSENFREIKKIPYKNNFLLQNKKNGVKGPLNQLDRGGFSPQTPDGFG